MLPSSGTLNLSSACKLLKYSYLCAEGESQDKVEVLLERENIIFKSMTAEKYL
jgi:hypothetical protein